MARERARETWAQQALFYASFTNVAQASYCDGGNEWRRRAGGRLDLPEGPLLDDDDDDDAPSLTRPVNAEVAPLCGFVADDKAVDGGPRGGTSSRSADASCRICRKSSIDRMLGRVGAIIAAGSTSSSASAASASSAAATAISFALCISLLYISPRRMSERRESGSGSCSCSCSCSWLWLLLLLLLLRRCRLRHSSVSDELSGREGLLERILGWMGQLNMVREQAIRFDGP
jgi:hypothetical protein